MFLVRWLDEALYYFGLKQPKIANILLLGLDNAGKTTLLWMMIHSRLMMICNYRSNVEEVVLGHTTLRVNDMGGHEYARRRWSDYFESTQGVIFVIDAADERLEEAGEELEMLLSHETLINKPFLILGNKIDLMNAVSTQEIRDVVDRTLNRAGVWRDQKQIELYMCSAARSVGYREGFEWLVEALVHN
mmetsp:Transcript_28111/g.50328  ORF Transcript_28111/g.50328 Transcript_28111/m.50328 type:complete len:189 (+) Transcript_28111:35-601(+)